MSNSNNKLVVDFLLSKVNPFYLETYNSLASLKYPIPDHLSFTQQLKGLEEKGKKGHPAKSAQWTERLVNIILGPTDFPISTPQSALEKFHVALLSLLESDGQLRNPRDDIGDFRKDSPGALEPTDCWEAARRACQDVKGEDGILCRIESYLECKASLATVSLPFAKRGHRPEEFFGR
jgi:hypothetical protein